MAFDRPRLCRLVPSNVMPGKGLAGGHAMAKLAGTRSPCHAV